MGTCSFRCVLPVVQRCFVLTLGQIDRRLYVLSEKIVRKHGALSGMIIDGARKIQHDIGKSRESAMMILTIPDTAMSPYTRYIYGAERGSEVA